MSVYRERFIKQVGIGFLLDKLRNTKNNGEFFDSMNT